MERQILAVIDTNVLVAALLTKNSTSATVRVRDCIVADIILPVFNEEILREYREVLLRPKFRFDEGLVDEFIQSIIDKGLNVNRTEYIGEMIDPNDRVFYEVSLTGDSYLVTGNKKHFPITPKVVTPAEIMAIIDGLE